MAGIGDMHVLIVDDSRAMRMLLRSMLTAVGVRNIHEADDAQAALRLLRGEIDLVLLDWQMQPMDGLTFARLIRRSPVSPRPFVPIIMLTAHTEISRVEAARDAGVNGFVRKPISTQQLFARMSSVLTDPRLFVRCESYMGPDRRRLAKALQYSGPFRRATDQAPDTFDLEDVA